MSSLSPLPLSQALSLSQADTFVNTLPTVNIATKTAVTLAKFSQELAELKAVEKLEPLLIPDSSRYVYFPLKYEKFDKLWEQAQASNWTVGEVDLKDDKNHFATLTRPEQDFIAAILAFFASADGIVNENLSSMFTIDVQAQELRCLYATQQHIEAVHSKMYSTLIKEIIPEIEDQMKLFDAVSHFPCIRLKTDWCLKWIDRALPFHVRIVAFIIVEGLFFSGSFAAIFWLKKRGLMPGLTFSNELISRDEGLHVTTGIEVYNTLSWKASTGLVTQMMIEAVEIEQQFFHDILPSGLLGMNEALMCQYIEFIADFLLFNLNCPKYFRSINPFDFMDNISLQGKTNFFEKRVGEYQKAGTMGNNTHEFVLDADFWYTVCVCVCVCVRVIQ